MKTRLLAYLSCPACGEPGLSVTDPPGDVVEIESGTLACSACRASFPVVRGIPRLFPEAASYFDEAAPGKGENSDPLAKALRQTIENYSAYQGKVYAPLADRLDNEKILEARSGLSMSEFSGKVCLDAGCGVGRFARTMARANADLVVAFDAGYAVDEARARSMEYGNIEWIQADILRPPFRPETFDRVISIGVLNLTAKPDLGFFNLSKLVRKGGTYTVYVHLCAYVPWDKIHSIKTSLGHLYDIAFKERFRRIVARLPDETRLGVCKALWRFRELIESLKSKEAPGPFLANLIRRLGPNYSDKPLESAESNIARNFDTYSTPHQNSNELAEVIDWFEKTRRFRRIRFTPFRQSVTGWVDEPRMPHEAMLIEYFPARSIGEIEAGGVETERRTADTDGPA
jgi:uncharacterized protein YbaR (Trm112 family)/ubiquinone/menaquinone biosynthesis C-methylase UbiE